MNIYIKFFSFLIVLFFQCFTSDWPQDTHFTEFRRQTALLRKALAFKMYGTFDVFMDPKTGLPADSTKRSEVEALSIFDIQEATLGLEHFIGSLEVQIKYDSDKYQQRLYEEDVRGVAALVYELQDFTKRNQQMPFIKSCYPTLFAEQDMKLFKPLFKKNKKYFVDPRTKAQESFAREMKISRSRLPLSPEDFAESMKHFPEIQ